MVGDGLLLVELAETNQWIAGKRHKPNLECNPRAKSSASNGKLNIQRPYRFDPVIYATIVRLYLTQQWTNSQLFLSFAKHPRACDTSATTDGTATDGSTEANADKNDCFNPCHLCIGNPQLADESYQAMWRDQAQHWGIHKLWGRCRWCCIKGQWKWAGKSQCPRSQIPIKSQIPRSNDRRHPKEMRREGEKALSAARPNQYLRRTSTTIPSRNEFGSRCAGS